MGRDRPAEMPQGVGAPGRSLAANPSLRVRRSRKIVCVLLARAGGGRAAATREAGSFTGAGAAPDAALSRARHPATPGSRGAVQSLEKT